MGVQRIRNPKGVKADGVSMMVFPKNIFAPIQITWREAADLVLPWRHSPYVRRHRASLIISRIQVVSAVFALLIPLWIIVDALAFEPAVWTAIAPLRLVAAVIFLALAWPRQIDDPRSSALVMLVVMLLVPPVFYVISLPIISTVDPVGVAGFVRNLYEFLPDTVVAGLSLFPLTALEVALYWLAEFISMVGVELFIHQRDWISLAGPLWLLLLLGGTAMVSGMSQLQYMIALVRRVTFDPLTGALTRRAGAELLEGQFRHSLQNGLPLTVAFVDIDRFKQVNDGYGHDTGDRVLRHVARQLQRGLRQGDALVRWGGEEFLVVLAGTDKEGARVVISRLGAAGFGARPDGAPVTACFGLAERVGDGLKDEKEMIELADRRMYEAKISGRNRAVFAHGDVIADVVEVPPAPASASA